MPQSLNFTPPHECESGLTLDDVFFPMGSGLACFAGLYLGQMGVKSFWKEWRQGVAGPESMALVLEYAAGIRTLAPDDVLPVADAAGGCRLLPLCTGALRFSEPEDVLLTRLEREFAEMRADIDEATVFLLNPEALPTTAMQGTGRIVADASGLPEGAFTLSPLTQASCTQALRRIWQAIRTIKKGAPFRIVWSLVPGSGHAPLAEAVLRVAVAAVAAESGPAALIFEPEAATRSAAWPVTYGQMQQARLDLLEAFFRQCFAPKDATLAAVCLPALRRLGESCPTAPMPGASSFVDPVLAAMAAAAQSAVREQPGSPARLRLQNALAALSAVNMRDISGQDGGSRVPGVPTEGKVLFWGTGGRYRDLWQRHMPALRERCLGFVDNNTKNHGGFCDGLPVFSPAAAPLGQAEVVVVASCWLREISNQLRHLGFKGIIV